MRMERFTVTEMKRKSTTNALPCLPLFSRKLQPRVELLMNIQPAYTRPIAFLSETWLDKSLSNCSSSFFFLSSSFELTNNIRFFLLLPSEGKITVSPIMSSLRTGAGRDRDFKEKCRNKQRDLTLLLISVEFVIFCTTERVIQNLYSFLFLGDAGCCGWLNTKRKLERCRLTDERLLDSSANSLITICFFLRKYFWVFSWASDPCQSLLSNSGVGSNKKEKELITYRRLPAVQVRKAVKCID